MQRYYQDQEITISGHPEIDRRAAFHKAGHAAAIYLLNKRKNLPAIDFQIQLHEHNGAVSPFPVKIRGGRQIAAPISINRKASANMQASVEPDSLRLTYEADIINYLSGPLAEAKYVALHDDEMFNVNLLRPNSLSNYGGHADLKEIWLYLESFLSSLPEREAKLNELFAEAFRFVQAAENWKRITALAHHILDSAEASIGSEQITKVLRQERRTKINSRL